ncbi:MAG: tRNA (adenosine(37)-N6)-threonylcarbamoyltransferase complex ATPase subunit type 1 TsaE [Syntrophomonas sp.]|uniref:tRNA (adenosine(37)-N6)-threonylcarbamoyltransferase complex ATPase subunit type 1 TsaE n=1 Tax=Syntrophomonas sp. TaxID=2053627 RepID=UPI002625077B|nr:tRNA (adenosine(37)-N6)-threonylcarbamoyltransferase complex ATPase subunit type 1 TsaE [Syntrophomonas sp.]MDD2509809.1 tRNA (adenosine(37)-N6)-threonylcarbamoyltransferase complex ATPase subunit type 1 TsaE [Syntrophomonas sp.]MDD3879955.1 tRNA (adenosine(37)-N6)-threonylcarbamoyltransferase complex ATPase subunit type 1 TsaE [Syntrophomonas sp.]MDD4625631.1 tRNA (adenosine(37)-N6)-threonylcarbamoyltransferase complex ATPase subunit type 1 TsaE [Syntrophomonas sp.]
MHFTVKNDEEMQKLGHDLARVLEKGDIVYLSGVLGAGKTTLVRGISRGLGYSGRVNSPTFTLLNIYPAPTQIFHFDLYRLEDSDLHDLGWEEYLEGDGISLIEWPEAGEGQFPREAMFIDIKLCDDDYERERVVGICARGEKYQHKLEELKALVDTGY